MVCNALAAQGVQLLHHGEPLRVGRGALSSRALLLAGSEAATAAAPPPRSGQDGCAAGAADGSQITTVVLPPHLPAVPRAASGVLAGPPPFQLLPAHGEGPAAGVSDVRPTRTLRRPVAKLAAWLRRGARPTQGSAAGAALRSWRPSCRSVGSSSSAASRVGSSGSGPVCAPAPLAALLAAPCSASVGGALLAPGAGAATELPGEPGSFTRQLCPLPLSAAGPSRGQGCTSAAPCTDAVPKATAGASAGGAVATAGVRAGSHVGAPRSGVIMDSALSWFKNAFKKHDRPASATGGASGSGAAPGEASTSGSASAAAGLAPPPLPLPPGGFRRPTIGGSGRHGPRDMT